MRDILIVEDGKKDRERLEKVFTAEGYSVVACENVTDAEKHLEHDEFRLAILDIGLSDKSGSYLFGNIKRRGKVSYIIIFTGNPSVHLKQRFMDEGAVDYIVKGSPQAQNDQILARVKELLGSAEKRQHDGIDLEYFLNTHVAESSRKLFLGMDNCFPDCTKCGARKYVVTFTQKEQLPPDVTGLVVCAACGTAMDPTVG